MTGYSPAQLDDEKVSRIIRLEAEDNYTNIHFSEGPPLLTSFTLSRYEKRLSEFVRISKGHLVNPAYVDRTAIYGPVVMVRMQNNDELRVARRRHYTVLKRLGYK